MVRRLAGGAGPSKTGDGRLSREKEILHLSHLWIVSYSVSLFLRSEKQGICKLFQPTCLHFQSLKKLMG